MAFDESLTGGTTSKIVEVMVRDSTTGAGKTGLAFGDVTASYCREGSTRTAITLASGTAGDAYSSGKWCEVDATNQKGLYQLHVPDAAIAVGVAASTISLQATGMIDKAMRLKLETPVNVTQMSGSSTAADNLETAALAYSATRGLSGTALPASAADAAGGLVISDAGGLDIDAKLANTNEVTTARMAALTDWINGGRLDLLLDEVKAITDQFVFTVANQVDANALSGGGGGLDASGVRAAIGMAAANMDTQLSGLAGDQGSGANSITPTVDDGTDPVESARVRFTKGAESYIATTNATGTFTTPFSLDNGTWTVAITLPGYSFTQTTLVITGDATPTYSMTSVGLSPPVSPAIKAYIEVVDAATKAPKVGVALTVVVTGPASSGGYGSDVTSITVTSNAIGVAEWNVIPGERYTITGPNSVAHSVEIPSTATDPYPVQSILV